MAKRSKPLFGISTEQAAEYLGWDSSLVRRLCKRFDIGQVISRRRRILTAADLARLERAKRDRPGRPPSAGK
jgi:hypothetical protein